MKKRRIVITIETEEVCIRRQDARAESPENAVVSNAVAEKREFPPGRGDTDPATSMPPKAAAP